ncbi:MAG TPA: alpha/beta fold hydrolase [Actinomycetota bacterium]|nr:alpha/beta fold hydrolase [Actinomycetota bacterium]
MLIHGFRGSLRTWAPVQAPVDRFTRVCSYSRAGLGRSEPRAHPPSRVDGADLAVELRTLLRRSGVPGPYVPVGHSFGGAIAQLFADRYGSEVSGVVLVDPVPATFLSVPRSRLYRIAGKARVERFLTRGAREGGTVVDIERLGKQLLAAGGLSELPLVLVTRGLTPADSTPAFEQLWTELQRQEARLSPNAVHVIAARSGHGIQRDQPKLVIRAIRQVVTATRLGTSLPPCPRLFLGRGAECAP